MLHRYIDEVEVKRCGHCERWLPLSAFQRRARNWDGLQLWCRECKKDSGAKWRAGNKEKVKGYYLEKREEVKNRSSEYRVNNPDKVNANNAKRRALKRGATVEPVTAEDLDIVRAEYGGICPYCNERIVEGHFDHIVPLAGGGEHASDNLAYVCARCNLEKGAKPLLVFMLDRVG